MDAVLTAAAVVTPHRVLRPGWVRIAGDRIESVGEGVAPGVDAVDLGGAIVVAGFVDVHCHGGGGASFGADAEASARAAATHLAHGSTSVVASLVTGPQDRLLREIASLTGLVEDRLIAGVHLEGPWLSRAQCGSHDPSQLRAPIPDEVRALVTSPVVRMVTLAPELDGALDAVRAIVDAGAVAAVGHTDADLATTRAAVEAGARQATHLFNAMRPLRHRDPGPVLAMLEDERVALELVRDGVHLDAGLCAWLDTTVASHRLVAVTDAMAAAAGRDGRYDLGSLEVDVVDGVARVAGTVTIAGSTATADVLFRSVAGTAYDDSSLVRAGLQTATNPARALGLDRVGALTAGLRADLVVLDPTSLTVRGVLRAGSWVRTPSPISGCGSGPPGPAGVA